MVNPCGEFRLRYDELGFCAMKLLAAVDQNWGIGLRGELLVRLSDDMKRFRHLTNGGILVYGRRTLETFPKGRPLPGRLNIVMSRQPDIVVNGATVCHSLAELGRTLLAEDERPIWVIGGESLYRQLLPFCCYAFITKVDSRREADAFIPDLDAAGNWHLVRQEPWQTGVNDLNREQEEVLKFRYCQYQQPVAFGLEQLARYDDRV